LGIFLPKEEDPEEEDPEEHMVEMRDMQKSRALPLAEEDSGGQGIASGSSKR
jgi:hypothetical protein